MSTIGISAWLGFCSQAPNARLDDTKVVLELAKQDTEIEVGPISNRSCQSFTMRPEIKQDIELSGLNIGRDDRFDSTAHVCWVSSDCMLAAEFFAPDEKPLAYRLATTTATNAGIYRA